MQHYPLKPRYFEKVEGITREWNSDPDELPYAHKLLCNYLIHPDSASNQPVVSNAFGKLSSILFVIPSFLLPAPHFMQVYDFLFESLPSYTSVYIITHCSSKKALEQRIRRRSERKSHIISVPDHLQITPWAADPFRFCESDHLHITEPFLFGRKDDQLLSYFLEKEGLARRQRMPFYFEGGNIIVGDDFYITGVDYLVRTMLTMKKAGLPFTIKEIENLFQSLDPHRKLILCGSDLFIPHEETRKFTIKGEEREEIVFAKNAKGTSQPMFHIDMFISLAGRNIEGKPVVLIGDPAMAARILKTPVTREMLQEVFDDIALTFIHKGFEVIRNPLPLIYLDDEDQKKRFWHFASSNNVITEICQDSRQVWMPTFGYGPWQELKQTDAENKRIWEEAGFIVHNLPDCNPFAENNGVVHCLAQYLRRNH